MTEAATVTPPRSTSISPRSPATPVRLPAVDSVSTPEPGIVPAGRRGTLILDRRVVEKIAAQAASEVSAAGAATGGFLGLGARSDLTARPTVTADLVGATAALEMDLVVAYPTPIRQTATRVRQHVTSRVQRLTGVEVTRVDLTVTGTHRSDDQSENQSAQPQPGENR